MLTLGLSGAGGDEAPRLEGAGFWRRALARGVDLLVHLFVGFTTGATAGILVVIGAALQGGSPDAAIERLSVNTPMGFAAALLGDTVMHVLSEGLHGSTVGKWLCGIIVISEDGGPSTLTGALKRSLAYVVDALFFGLVAAHKMSESPKRQRIGDLWGHTMVVRIAILDASSRRSRLRFLGAVSAGIAANGFIIFIELASRQLS